MNDDPPLTELADWLARWFFEVGYAWSEVEGTMEIAALKRGSRRWSRSYDG